MNEQIKELYDQAIVLESNGDYVAGELDPQKFAELIVEECRNVVTEVYRNTPLELCGPLLTADEKIAKHFYRVEEPEDSACPLCGEDGGTTCGMPGCQY